MGEMADYYLGLEDYFEYQEENERPIDGEDCDKCGMEDLRLINSKLYEYSGKYGSIFLLNFKVYDINAYL